MKRTILITCLIISCISCKSEKNSKTVNITEHNTQIENKNDELDDTSNTNGILLDMDFGEVPNNIESEEQDIYTFDRFKEDFYYTYEYALVPIGTYFWDEFEDFKMQYTLTEDESKLLGEWINVTFMTENYYNTYIFYPNKLFLLPFKFGNYYIIGNNELFFYNALGTWEIVNGIVQITIYAIITRDYEGDNPYPYPFKENVIFVDQPYTIDFINIDDIGKEGFTKRPINDAILSDELKQMVNIKKPNRTNNMYVRSVYTIDVIPTENKNYHFFQHFPEMAKENYSGLDIVTNKELIEKYIYKLR